MNIQSYINTIAKCSRPAEGVTRLPFTNDHVAANKLLKRWMTDAGLKINLDAAGTLIGKYISPIKNSKTLLIGSHQDSGYNSGRYDGIMGIILPILALKELNKKKISLPFNVEILAVGFLATSSGFITIFPDYVGMANPNVYHPYHIKDSYVRAVLHMIKAVKQLSQTLINEQSFQYNDQLFLAGYSEGGYATLAAQSGIEQLNNEEFHITASFPMAGAYDLAGTMVDYFLSEPEYENPYYVPYVLTSHVWYYQGINTDLNIYFEPYWAETLPNLYNGTYSGSQINNMLPDNVLDILIDSVLTDFTINDDHFLRQTLSQNTLLDWVPNSPTYLYHGLADDQVPHENSVVAYNAFQSNGASNVVLELLPESAGGHTSAAIPSIISGYNLMTEYMMINQKGDMDGDGDVTLIDQAYLSAMIINDLYSTDFQFWLANLNYDSEINVIDILMISDIAVSGGF